MSKSIIRAVGYCRTSGEGQRDNTSIPSQKESIETYCERERWSFARHYVDESKTGSKIEGRDQFQKMMRNAANQQFDIVVVFDISRFARDGFDIIESARTLKRDFGVDVVDCKGHFDTRKPANALINFVHAGVAENERLTIMQRTNLGRIATAKAGKPWARSPMGRAFNKKTGKWYVTEKGRNIAKALNRYLDGESLTELCQEYGLGKPCNIYDMVAKSQLSGTYHVRIAAKEVGIDETIPVPAMPEIVPASVHEKVKKRLLHRRSHNRVDVTRYPLSGFVRCAKCGRSLTGQISFGKARYYHQKNDNCKHRSFPCDLLEPAILDYLFSFFLDEPSYNEAVYRAMPSADRRMELVNEREATQKRLGKNQKEIQRLIDAVKQGAKVSILLDAQDKLEEEKAVLSNRLRKIESDLATLPSVEQTELAAMTIRIMLTAKYQFRDWRQMEHQDIQRFLFHLLGERNPMAKTGAFVERDDNGQIVVTFKGMVEFHHEVVDGRPVLDAMQIESLIHNNKVNRMFRELEKKHLEEKRAIRPSRDFTTKRSAATRRTSARRSSK